MQEQRIAAVDLALQPYITAPSEYSQAQFTAIGTRELRRSDAQGAVILLVEDDPSVRALLAHVLRREGHYVIEAADGTHALDIMASQSNPEPQILLSDVIMPRMGGLDLACYLREHGHLLHVIFMTGYTDLAFNETQTVLLRKPFSPSTLAMIVRQMIAS